jgi:hypothetical protein
MQARVPNRIIKKVLVLMFSLLLFYPSLFERA